MLTGTRLWRPSAVSLVLVLLVALLAPLLLAPAPAQADVCDVPGISQACAVGGAAAGAVDDAAGAMSDVAKGAVKGAKTAASWVGDNAGNVLKAAIAIGLPLATWVACSKVAKVVAAAGAATAAGAGSAGAGAAPGAVAGAAGAQAVCMVLKKGGKVLLKVGKKAAKSGGKLANIAKLAAGAVGLAAIVYGVDHAAAWVLQNLLDFDAVSAPSLDAGWLTKLRQSLNGMAGLLLLLATILGMTLAGVMGRASDVGRIFTSMISVALIIGVVGSLLLAGLRVSDEVTSGTLNSTWGQQALGNWKDLGDSYAEATPKKDDDSPGAADAAAAANPDDASATPSSQTGTPQDDKKGPWPIRLLIAFCTALFGALVKLEMLVRDGLLYLLLAFGGLLLAGYPFAATRGIAQRFGMTLLGVVVAKPVIVITLLIGGAMMQSAAAGSEDSTVIPMLQGAGLMALAALMGSAILAWFSLHGASAMSGLGNRMVAGGGRGFGASRSGGSGGSGGPSDGGSGGGGAGGPDRPDPTRDLARGVGDRVNASAAGAAGAGAMGATGGFAGGAMSSRLQAAQNREQQSTQASPGGDPGGPAGASAGSEAPTQTMAALSNGHGAPRDDASGSATDTDPDGSGGPQERPSAPSRRQSGVPAAAPGAAAHETAGGNGPSGAGAVPAAAELAAPQTGAVADQSGASASTPTAASAGAPSSSTSAPPSDADAAVAGPQGAVPDASVSPAATAMGRPIDPDAPPADTPRSFTANGAAYAAFGAPAPQDAAAAFGEHATKVRAALNDRPEVKA